MVERRMRKEVKNSAKRDRAAWIENLTAKGDWASIKKLTKPRPHPQGRLRDSSGELVSTDCRAETFAQHLDSIHWYVRPITLVPDTNVELHPPLDVNTGPFTDAELRKTLKKLHKGKASKPNDIPVEVFQAMAEEPGQLHWLLDICNDVWEQKTLPEEWSTADVRLLFKKGDPANCDNYRPLSLQCVALKVFSTMLKERLVEAGVESRLWKSQFGFRPGCSTEHAIYIARRQIELARARQRGGTTLVALDWKKAFDSIRIESMLDALRRLGIPPASMDMVGELMRQRLVVVDECGARSTPRPQRSGISQGCTLSPLLFVLVMTVLLADAVEMLGRPAKQAYDNGDLADCVYADDTLLI